MRVNHVDVMHGYNPEFVRKVQERRARLVQYKAENERLRRLAEKQQGADLLNPLDAFLAKIPRTEYQRIVRRACKVFNVTPLEINGRSRPINLALARHFICYWACRRTKHSCVHIGRLMGGRDHTSILHGKTAYIAKRARMGRNLPLVR